MNPEQSHSSNLQNSSFSSSTDHITNSNSIHSQSETSFSTPILSIPQTQSQQEDKNHNHNMMNDKELYEYLYNPNRLIQLNSLSTFLKTQLNEVNKLKVLNSIQFNQSNGKFYEAWLKSHSTTTSSNSTANQVSQNNESLPFMEIDQHQSSDSINHSMTYDIPNENHNSNDLPQVDTGVDVEMSER